MGGNGIIRVLIAGVDNTTVHAVSNLLEAAGGVRVVGVARTIDEIVPRAMTLAPAVAVLSADFGGREIEINITRLQRLRPPVRPVIFRVREPFAASHALVEAGAAAVVNASDPPEMLLRAVRRVAGTRRITDGESLLGGPGARIKHFPPPFRLFDPLTPREREVLQLAAEGISNDQIAGRLGRSVNTVKAHLRSSYQKLGVHSKLQAVIAVRDGRLGLTSRVRAHE